MNPNIRQSNIEKHLLNLDQHNPQQNNGAQLDPKGQGNQSDVIDDMTNPQDMDNNNHQDKFQGTANDEQYMAEGNNGFSNDFNKF